MPSDDIYKILIEYIQEDNKFKNELLTRVSGIEYQTKQTNGRLLKVEATVSDLQTKDAEEVITKKVNWKFIGPALAGLLFLTEAVFFFALDWIKSRFIN